MAHRMHTHLFIDLHVHWPRVLVCAQANAHTPSQQVLDAQLRMYVSLNVAL